MKSPSKQQISNCCKAEIKVHNEDEGTCYYECLNCHQPCDPYSEQQTMSESNWEKEFDEYFESCFEPNNLEMNIYKKWRSSSGTRERAIATIDDFKDFILQEKQKSFDEAIKKVEKIIGEDRKLWPNESEKENPVYDINAPIKGYNSCLSDIRQKLQSLLKQ